MDKPIIIIGAGMGGLSAAVHLAAQGKKVVVLEKNHQIGGKLNQVEADGFRWDTGPSVITMKHVFEELFATAGRQLGEYVQFEPIDPLTRYFYQDGTVIDVTQNLPEMLAQIEALEPADVDGYLSYLAYAAKIHRITGPVFIYDHPPSVQSFTRVPPTDIFKIDPLRKMSAAINAHVKSPHLRQLLGRFATYVGASPYLAPATLNVIAHVELNGGVWYPRGGIYALGRAVEQLARELGVIIHTGCQVEKIELTPSGDGVAAVVTKEGRFESETIIANVDVTTVFNHLIDPHPKLARISKKQTQLETSCSGFALLLGVNGSYPELAHHNIFFSGDYQQEFKEIFDEQVMPNDPTIYVAITSKSDAEHAPDGMENWFILVNAPPLSDRWDWSKEGQAYRDLILEKLNRYGLEIGDQIVAEQWITPEDLQAQTGAFRGALYGISSNDMWAAFRRPHNRSKEVKGLYFCGGTTHPGGGVPMVTLSGKIAAEMALEGVTGS
ncbi:MAG: phytoene desaturase family protein [Chloroflexota bacterium]